MADFLDTFKRRESSEGSIDDEDEYQDQFAREEIRHHSDDEDAPKQNKARHPQEQSRNNDERKKIVVNEKRREAEASNREGNQKKDHYLYEGEEKPYESDSGEQEQGQGQKDQKKENAKQEKKDPTFVPKGSFYQHDTRGEDVEFIQKKNDKLNKYKWKHDKFEKNYNNQNENYNDYRGPNRDYVKKDTYQEKKSQVYYVPKGENQQKTYAEDEQQRRPENSQRQNKNYNYKGQYNKDRGYTKNQPADTYQYVKKDASKPVDDNKDKAAATNKNYYVEYVPKKQETK